VRCAWACVLACERVVRCALCVRSALRVVRCAVSVLVRVCRAVPRACVRVRVGVRSSR